VRTDSLHDHELNHFNFRHRARASRQNHIIILVHYDSSGGKGKVLVNTSGDILYDSHSLSRPDEHFAVRNVCVRRILLGLKCSALSYEFGVIQLCGHAV